MRGDVMTATKSHDRHSSIDQKQKELVKASRIRTQKLVQRAEKLGLIEKRQQPRNKNKPRTLIK